jgi:hypothetical protein
MVRVAPWRVGSPTRRTASRSLRPDQLRHNCRSVLARTIGQYSFVIRVRRATSVAMVILVVVLSGCSSSKSFPPGPYLQDASGTKKDTHWHAALGVYDCDHWMSDGSGNGVWIWPAVSPQGGPARVSNANVYAGLHSHDDGVIHMEPLSPDEAGRNATVGLYFEFGGWRLSLTSFSFLGTTVKNGDKCGKGTGIVQWELGKWDGTSGKQRYAVQSGDSAKYKLFQGDIVVLAFLPKGKTLASIGDPPSIPNLAKALGVSEAQGVLTPGTP